MGSWFVGLKGYSLKSFLGIDHGFKNRTGKRTGKGSGSRTTGPTGVGPVVEPVTS